MLKRRNDGGRGAVLNVVRRAHEQDARVTFDVSPHGRNHLRSSVVPSFTSTLTSCFRFAPMNGRVTTMRPSFGSALPSLTYWLCGRTGQSIVASLGRWMRHPLWANHSPDSPVARWIG